MQGMKTYQIEIKDSAGTPVKRFFWDSDEDTAYEMFHEWAARYDSSHQVDLSYRRTGKLLPKGRKSGTAKSTPRRTRH